MTRCLTTRHRLRVSLSLAWTCALAWAFTWTIAAPPANAQAPDAAVTANLLEDGRRAVTACADALETGSGDAAAAWADEAEAAFGAARVDAPLESALGVAETLLRCRIAPAPMLEKAALAGRIEQALGTVLALDPDHLEAHYLLGTLLAHLPPFLGRDGDAVEHLERVLALAPTPVAVPPDTLVLLEELRRRGARPAPDEPPEVGKPVAPDDLHRRLVDEVAAPAVPGLAVGLARGDDVLLLEGVGLAEVENEVPLTADHVLRIGSVSKQFLAVLTLRLAEAGRLSLNDPVSRWLPGHEYPLTDLRVRHLLNHTAGLPRDAVGSAHWLEDSLAAPRVGRPGERYLYSNLGYAVLGRVVEAAGDGAYDDLLRRWVLDPAGLDATGPCDERAIVPRRAQGYAWRAGTLIHDDPVAERPELHYAGGLCSTARDLLHWLLVLHGGDLLGADGYRELTTPPTVIDPAGTTYAAGLQTVDAHGLPTLRHGGAISGFLAETAYRADERLAVVVLANGEAADPRRVAAELLDLALRMDTAP